MNRIYGNKIDISSQEVQSFFEARFNKEDLLASVMLRSEETAHIAKARDDNENALLHTLFDENKKYHFLDIGCGCGRLANHLKEKALSYTGIDFTHAYVEAAKELYKDDENIQFYQMSANNLDLALLKKNYDIILITGLCVYLNDDDVKNLFLSLQSLLSEESKIYFRESISILENRLTLKNFPSEELKTNYNAIYRTKEEYELLLTHFLPKACIQKTNLLLTKETGAREETNQQYWYLKYSL